MEGSKFHAHIFATCPSTCNHKHSGVVSESEVSGTQMLLVSILVQRVIFQKLSQVIHPKVETPTEAVVFVSENTGLRDLKHQQTDI